ncbi:MAG TPA: hypothetical protein VM364_08105 [Vicinamibacterales bacterium]|nr:hypothetical protein [Vicinamibacterales bacterium]
MNTAPRIPPRRPDSHQSGVPGAWIVAMLLAAVTLLAVAIDAQPPTESSLGYHDAMPEIVGMSGDCAGYVIGSGRVDAAAHEIEEGFAAIGGVSLSMRPSSPLWRRVVELHGQPVEVVIRPVRPRGLERVER